MSATGGFNSRDWAGGGRVRVIRRAGALWACLAVVLVVSAAATSPANAIVLAWGVNNSSQLGDGTNAGPETCGGTSGPACSRAPVPVALSLPVGVSVKAVSAGGESNGAALLSNDAVVSWGGNVAGQLGDGTFTGPETCLPDPFLSTNYCSRTPVPVSLDLPAGVSVREISAGAAYSLALLSNGSVMAWGDNQSGELGDGTTSSSDVPVAVSLPPDTTAVAVSAGSYHSLAVLSDGTVLAWGANNEGQLGIGTTSGPETCPGGACSRTPVQVSALTGVVGVSAGEKGPVGHTSNSLAVLGNGTVRGWGYGQDSPVPICAIGQTPPCSESDGNVLEHVVEVSAGNAYSLARLSSGTVDSWDGCCEVPTEVRGLSGVTAISAGEGHSLALLEDGAVMAWGASNDGQLGDGAENSSSTPVAVIGLEGATEISASAWNSLAIANVKEENNEEHTGEAPEFGRCVKVAKDAGKYKSSGCTSLGGSEDYEWFAGVVTPPFTTKLSSGSVTLESVVLAAKMVCTGETGTGAYTGLKKVGTVVLKFTGCVLAGESCSSAGSAPGEVVTETLDGVLGVEKLGADSLKNKIGLDLYPAASSSLIAFSCGASTHAVLQGSVIVPVEANKMGLSQTLKFKESKGKQKPERFVVARQDILEQSINSAPFEQAGVTMTVTQASGEEVEVNSVV